MNTPVFSLTLALLLLAPALGADYRDSDGYWLFRHYHIKLSASEFSCDHEMDWKQPSATVCRPSDVIILGDDSDDASLDQIVSICRGEGTALGDNKFTSTKRFRLVKCILQNKGAVRPNCSYKAKYMRDQITVACKDGYPVYLEGSD